MSSVTADALGLRQHLPNELLFSTVDVIIPRCNARHNWRRYGDAAKKAELGALGEPWFTTLLSFSSVNHALRCYVFTRLYEHLKINFCRKRTTKVHSLELELAKKQYIKSVFLSTFTDLPKRQYCRTNKLWKLYRDCVYNWEYLFERDVLQVMVACKGTLGEITLYGREQHLHSRRNGRACQLVNPAIIQDVAFRALSFCKFPCLKQLKLYTVGQHLYGSLCKALDASIARSPIFETYAGDKLRLAALHPGEEFRNLRSNLEGIERIYLCAWTERSLGTWDVQEANSDDDERVDGRDGGNDEQGQAGEEPVENGDGAALANSAGHGYLETRPLLYLIKLLSTTLKHLGVEMSGGANWRFPDLVVSASPSTTSLALYKVKFGGTLLENLLKFPQVQVLVLEDMVLSAESGETWESLFTALSDHDAFPSLNKVTLSNLKYIKSGPSPPGYYWTCDYAAARKAKELNIGLRDVRTTVGWTCCFGLCTPRKEDIQLWERLKARVGELVKPKKQEQGASCVEEICYHEGEPPARGRPPRA